MYAKRGGVAAYHIVLEERPKCACSRTPGTLLKHKPIQTIWYAATPPRLAYIQLWLNNNDFGKDIVTPCWWS